MFFADTLGPAITARTGAALFEHVRLKLGARTSASADELSAIVIEFIHARRLILTPGAAIQYLAMNGRVAQQDAVTFRLAA